MADRCRAHAQFGGELSNRWETVAGGQIARSDETGDGSRDAVRCRFFDSGGNRFHKFCFLEFAFFRFIATNAARAYVYSTVTNRNVSEMFTAHNNKTK